MKAWIVAEEEDVTLVVVDCESRLLGCGFSEGSWPFSSWPRNRYDHLKTYTTFIVTFLLCINMEAEELTRGCKLALFSLHAALVSDGILY